MKSEKEKILGYLYILNKDLEKVFLEKFKALKITPAEAEIVAEIGKGCHCSLNLQEKREVNKSNVSQKVKSLENKKIIKRVTSKDDRRKKEIILTKKGEKIFVEIKKKVDEILEIMFKNLSQKEILEIEKNISKLKLK